MGGLRGQFRATQGQDVFRADEIDGCPGQSGCSKFTRGESGNATIIRQPTLQKFAGKPDRRIIFPREETSVSRVLRFVFGSVRSLRSETAWFRAISHLWRFVAQARPFARIAPGRRLPGRDTGSFAALPPSPTPPYTHGRRLHSAPAPARRPLSLDIGDTLKRR